MTKPTMDLVEEYGRRYGSKGQKERSDALLSEIRQRLEAMERREAELEADLMEAAKCALQYAAKAGELERDAAIGRHVVERGTWHRFSDGPDDKDAYSIAGIRLPYAALLDCAGMRRHAIDAAMAEGE